MNEKVIFEGKLYLRSHYEDGSVFLHPLDGPWPQKRDQFFYITENTQISFDIWNGTDLQKWLKKQGKIFLSKKAAQNQLKRDRLTAELHEIALEVNGADWVPDFESGRQLKYTLDRTIESGRSVLAQTTYLWSPGNVYFKTDQIPDRAKEITKALYDCRTQQ